MEREDRNMTYREALEKGVEKWEKLSIFQSALNAGDMIAALEIERLLGADCSVCGYHNMTCSRCILCKKGLCVKAGTDSGMAFYVFVDSPDNNEKLTAARQIRDVLREELRRVTEEEAENAEKRQG
jgi:hypothetical protein